MHEYDDPGSNMITHRMVQAFRAVLQSGSVTRAAAVLNVSQPSVSRLLADLETRTGLSLFERRGPRLTPTAAGLELYEDVERAFVGLEHVRDAAEQIRSRHSGVLTVAAISAVGYALLPQVLQAFRAEPGAPRLRLHIVPSQQALTMLSLRRCDLAFAVIPPSAEIGRQLHDFPMRGRVILPAGHRLAHGRRPLEPGDLVGEPMVALVTQSLPRIDTDKAFALAGVTPTIVAETMQSYSAAQLVRAGLGFAIVDPMTAGAHEAQGGASRAFAQDVDFSFGAYAWRATHAGDWIERLCAFTAAAVAALRHG